MADTSPRPSAAIYGCAGTQLTDEEKRLFSKCNPVGFILFSRNCGNPSQIKSLVEDLRDCTKSGDPLILIDQEGGRVARLQPPHWRKYPAARTLAGLGGAQAEEAVYLNSRLLAADLLPLGINVDCLPLADVPAEDSHDIIGDRAYATEPGQVAKLGREAARGLLEGGVLPVLKHIPGHGRATVDSHHELPVVTASLETLQATDFAPFKALADLPLGMTAHVLYKALDEQNVATLSPSVIKLIREEIGFDGLLMSDDISMKALKGNLAELSGKALAAGCDVVLHCNGNIHEMNEIASVAKLMNEDGWRRLQHAKQMRVSPAPFNVTNAEARMRGWLPESYAA